MEKIAVIGCGTMGHSIALNAAWAGYDVKMQGIDYEDIDRGLESQSFILERALFHLIEEGKCRKVSYRISKVSENIIW